MQCDNFVTCTIFRFCFNGSVPQGNRKKISEDELSSWNLLGEFRAILEKAMPARSRTRPKGGPKRLLSELDYFCAFLFAQFNPVIDSMRGLCACSKLERVQQDVCSRPISLGSFSEAQSVFGYERLEKVFESLVKENLRSGASGAGGLGKAPPALLLVDSSVFRAVPRMCWAQWRHQNTTQRAVRLHLKFNLFDQEPSEVSITEGRCCERKALAKIISPGEFYVGDRYYGRDYKWLKSLEQSDCDYVIRLCENATMTIIEEFELDEEDKAAGVVSDQIVRLGSKGSKQHGPIRVVRIEKPELDEPVILGTNHLDRACFSAALIAEIYHQRWAIELFFRWFKCVLGRAGNWHWLAESPDGVAIQLYTALIAALLLARQLGRLPSKRCMEMLRFHSMEMASNEELEAVIEGELRKRSN